MKKERFNRFSVPLGLLDYVNPLFYSITIITIIRNVAPLLEKPYDKILIAGAILSIFFGFIIPTGKVIVGLGIIKFVMPVILVFLVNTGIFLSGSMLFKYVWGLRPVMIFIIDLIIILLLIRLYSKKRKMNTVAVLIGAFGYVLIYLSLITYSIKKGNIIPALLCGVAIFLFVMLCGIGIKADLKDPRVHWKIEVSNVICQGLVALATVLLFR
ncbi:MAG: hypothetical protein IJI46_03530 [Erysipelotrichaceae bacterium]|nr:hypothetical protein [Erysipelotrichaceae bacterium]